MPRWRDKERRPLARLRVKAGLSQTEASVNLGVSIATLVRYESGTNDLSIKLGEQMAALYGVTFDEVRAAIAETKSQACDRDAGAEKLSGKTATAASPDRRKPQPAKVTIEETSDFDKFFTDIDNCADDEEMRDKEFEAYRTALKKKIEEELRGSAGQG